MESLRKKNSLLQKEINSRRSDQNIDDLRMTNFSMKQKLNSLQQQVRNSEEELLKLRAQNNIHIDLLDDSFTDYKMNIPLFIGKRIAQIQLDNKNETDFKLKPQ